MGTDSDLDAAELIRRAAEIHDPESDQRWALIVRLHARVDREAFEAAVAAACAPEVEHRLAGVDVLGQIGYKAGRPYHEETLQLLLAEVQHATDPRLIQAVVAALGHLHDERALVAVLAKATHDDPSVRHAVAWALPALCDVSLPPETVVQTLIALTRDADPHIRDWATFGLGSQIESDTPAIREALAARLNDSHAETAAEAKLGLAQRRDPRGDFGGS